jgi:hypothetical protein
MPRTQPSDALSRWLAAEQGGLLDAADAALAELLSAQPRPVPAAGFADRVLARAVEVAGAPAIVAAAAAGRRAPRRAARWHRWQRIRPWLGLAAAALGVAGVLGLPVLLRAMPALLSASSIAWVLQTAISTVLAGSELVASLVSIGNNLLLLVRAVAKPLATLPMAGLALAALLVSVVALRFLVALIQRDRRWVYADPI